MQVWTADKKRLHVLQKSLGIVLNMQTVNWHYAAVKFSKEFQQKRFLYGSASNANQDNLET